MGKAALGKGMKDLLAKNFGLADEEAESKDKNEAAEELKVNISRYHAQGFDVEQLKELKGKSASEIMKGIESYRAGVKILNTAQTILRALEGYGYNKEIDLINEKIKNPSRAREVLEEVQELKERARTEHDLGDGKKGPQASRLSESLREKSEMLRQGAAEDDVDIDEEALDDLLSDLDDIGTAFSLDIDDDPLLSKISRWEEEGYFVDGLKKALADDRERAETEAKQFEKDVARIEPLKRRFREMDLTGMDDEVSDLLLKFQYPHLAKDIENELDRIEAMGKKADEKTTEQEVAPETTEEEEIPEKPPGETLEDVPPKEPEKTVSEPPEDEVVEEKEKEKPISPPVRESEPEPEEEASEYSHHSAEDLMEMAKDAYKNGDLELSLTLFKEILKKDPDSSKARFMIRRLSSKV